MQAVMYTTTISQAILLDPPCLFGGSRRITGLLEPLLVNGVVKPDTVTSDTQAIQIIHPIANRYF